MLFFKIYSLNWKFCLALIINNYFTKLELPVLDFVLSLRKINKITTILDRDVNNKTFLLHYITIRLEWRVSIDLFTSSFEFSHCFNNVSSGLPTVYSLWSAWLFKEGFWISFPTVKAKKKRFSPVFLQLIHDLPFLSKTTRICNLSLSGWTCLLSKLFKYFAKKSLSTVDKWEIFWL